jgi:hypothetical protein
MSAHRTSPRLRPLLIGAALLLVSGCSPAPSAGSGDAPPSAPLPEGVAVSVYQSRFDVVTRALQVSIENASTEDLVISGAEFRSTQFTEDAVWPKESTVVTAGRTIDLPVTLSDPVCDDLDPTPSVVLVWATGDGDEHTSEVTPTDERGRLAELRAEGCFDAAVAAVAEFSADTPPRTVTIGSVTAAELDVAVEPADGGAAAGGLLVESVGGTTLLTLLDPATGGATTSLPLGDRIDGAGRTITLTLVPTRCDPHAVAEDKQGTILPFTVEAPAIDGSGTSRGTVLVTTPTAVRQALISFIGEACGGSAE